MKNIRQNGLLFITPQFYPVIGGYENQALNLAKSFIKKGFSVTVLTERYPTELPVKDESFKIKIIRMPIKRIRILHTILILFFTLFYLFSLRNKFNLN